MTESIVPDGFAPHFRASPLTAPWEPLFSRRTADSVMIGLRIREVHCNSRGFVHGGLISAIADNAMGLSAGHLASALAPQVARSESGKRAVGAMRRCGLMFTALRSVAGRRLDELSTSPSAERPHPVQQYATSVRSNGFVASQDDLDDNDDQSFGLVARHQSVVELPVVRSRHQPSSHDAERNAGDQIARNVCSPRGELF